MATNPKAGRPSSYSEATATAICERLAVGQSLREICRDRDMPNKSTVFRWLAGNKEFREQYAAAHVVQADALAEEILEIADNATNDWMERQSGEETIVVADHDHISRSRLRVDARKWLMSKLAPKKYGDRVELEHSGKDGTPLVPVINVTVG